MVPKVGIAPVSRRVLPAAPALASENNVPYIPTKKTKEMAREEDNAPKKVTDIDAAKSNITAAVQAFADQWMPAPRFAVGVEVMGVSQLRDAMGLRATIDVGDPWPEAEELLLQRGFRWQMLSGMRVMMLQERNGYVPDTGWEEAEEV